MGKYQPNKLPVRWVQFVRSLCSQSLKYQLSNTSLVYCSTGCILLFSSVRAQAIPNPPLIEPPQPEEPELLPELPEIIPPAKRSIPPTPLSPDRIPGTIVIKRFEIVNNQVLSKAEIDRVVKPYLFRPVSFIELLEVQKALTKLYVDRGYITTGAFIPPQIIEDRVVKVEIIPGKIEEIKISGLEKLKEEYIRSRVEIATDPPLNHDQLLKALQLIQLNPLVANISAELSPGINPGTSFLEIEIEEADTLAVNLGLDNLRASNVGSVRRVIGIDEGNVFGWGDRFEISYSYTDGSNSLENVSYAIPVNASNGEIQLSHNRASGEIITEPFAGLDIDSSNRRYEVTYLQPLEQTPTSNFALGLSLSQQSTGTTIGNLPLQLAAGADNQGKTNVSSLRFFQELSDRNEKQVFVARSEFSLGIDAFNATIDDNLPDSRFFAWRGQVQYLRSLTSKTNLFMRSDLQLADDPLSSLEQFSSGGGVSVRGYRQDALTADNGIFVSTELRHNLLNPITTDTSLELISFVDFSRVWNVNDPEQLLDNTLFSVGIGLQLLVEDRLNLRIDWGIPLFGIETTGDSLQENGIHFYLETTVL